jgi:hypothetical protein
MILMARELHCFATKFDRLLGLECYVWHQTIRVVHLLQEVADGFERDDFEQPSADFFNDIEMTLRI